MTVNNTTLATVYNEVEYGLILTQKSLVANSLNHYACGNYNFSLTIKRHYNKLTESEC